MIKIYQAYEGRLSGRGVDFAKICACYEIGRDTVSSANTIARAYDTCW